MTAEDHLCYHCITVAIAGMAVAIVSFLSCHPVNSGQVTWSFGFRDSRGSGSRMEKGVQGFWFLWGVGV